MDFIKKNGLWLVIAFVAGAVAMDYLDYLKSKEKNYTKLSGFFKYTSKELI